MPAVPITMDRLVTDGTMAALTAAFVCYCRAPSRKLFAVLACAALTRETGVALLLAYCASLAWRCEFRLAGVFLLSAVPAAAWFGCVEVNTSGKSYGISPVPLSAIWQVLIHPATYPPGTTLAGVVRAADYLALAGMLLALGLALLWFARVPRDPLRIAALLFAAIALFSQRPDHWDNVYSYGRVHTPLLVCLAALAAQCRSVWLLAPVAMILPRLAIQLAPQAIGIIRWL